MSRLYKEGFFPLSSPFSFQIQRQQTGHWSPLLGQLSLFWLPIYLFIVNVGPKIMEKRRAYNLREVLIVCNFAIVLLSAYMMYEVSTEVPSCVFSWSVFVIFDIHFSFPFCLVSCLHGRSYRRCWIFRTLITCVDIYTTSVVTQNKIG